MTARQRIKLKLLVAARQAQPKDVEAFTRSAFENMAMMDGDLGAELDRIEALRGRQLGRLVAEVWNEYVRELSEAQLIEAWALRRI